LPERNWKLAEPRIRIAPSLLAADFARLADEIAGMEAAGAELLHFDIMDGHFVPNISMGVPVIEKLRPVTELFFDTHLMITDPMKYICPFAEAGSNLLTFHIETAKEPQKVIDLIRSLNVNVGITLNPSTPVADIVPVIKQVDLVLIMSVWPGFGGQTFIPSSLEKIREARPLLGTNQRLEVDGGIGPDTVREVVSAGSAGADTLVTGSAIFDEKDPPAAMRELDILAQKKR